MVVFCIFILGLLASTEYAGSAGFRARFGRRVEKPDEW
jgi:hypothetical protein